jgi:hypothetical protein
MSTLSPDFGVHRGGSAVLLRTVVTAGLAIFVIAAARPADAAPGLPAAGYDDQLCVTAQRLIVGQPDLPVRVQTGDGNGFYTIQMSVDPAARGLVIATTTGFATDGSTRYPAWVACKMIDRERASDVLGLATTAPARTCRDVNDHTLQVALNRLTPDQRARLEARGTRLTLADDTVLPTGGEWLPARVEDYVTAADGGYRVSAPAVVVPWDRREGGFFQGIRHCKLLTLATVERWLTAAAAGTDAPLLGAAAGGCRPDGPLESRVGSCLFYFAPTRALVCQDYSGVQWTEAAARQECGKRHASKAALDAAGKRYEGAGGVWADGSCAARGDAPRRAGSCVFQCGAADETLWHLPAGAGDAATLGRFCQVFVPAEQE